MLIENIQKDLDIWIKIIENTKDSNLSLQPEKNAWSLGQIAVHLIDSTYYFMEQIRICTSSHEHSTEEIKAPAKTMLDNNDFPDAKLVGPPSNAKTPQPSSKQALIHSLENLKTEIQVSKQLIDNSSFNGKTKHSSLGYFNSKEWLQFTEMHLRHHLRQYERLKTRF